MTQMPPPPPNYTSPYGYVPPRQTNGWAVTSLVTGLIGCAIVTPLVAIVTGLIGLSKSRRLGNGRGMSVAGIALGVVWLIGLAGVGAVIVFVFGKVNDLKSHAVPQTVAVINRVQQGNVTPDATTGQLTAQQLQDVADAAKGLGVCQGITTTGVKVDDANGSVEGVVDGNATFEHGSRPVHARLLMGQHGTTLTWQLEELELK